MIFVSLGILCISIFGWIKIYRISRVSVECSSRYREGYVFVHIVLESSEEIYGWVLLRDYNSMRFQTADREWKFTVFSKQNRVVPYRMIKSVDEVTDSKELNKRV